MFDLQEPPAPLGAQLRLGHVLPHELGLQRAAKLPVGGAEAVRGPESVEPQKRDGHGGVPSGERRVELADAVPLLGEQTEVHRPPSALEDRIHDAVIPCRASLLTRSSMHPGAMIPESWRNHPGICRPPPRPLRQPDRAEDAVDARCARRHALHLQDVGDLADR